MRRGGLFDHGPHSLPLNTYSNHVSFPPPRPAYVVSGVPSGRSSVLFFLGVQRGPQHRASVSRIGIARILPLPVLESQPGTTSEKGDFSPRAREVFSGGTEGKTITT